MSALNEFISVAEGRKKADLLLKNGQIVNVLSGEIYPANVAIYKDKTAGIGDYEAEEVLDLNGKYLSPGFIDAHVHLESSMLHPAEFAKAVIPQGTTAVIADPHEIANVLGVAGIKYMLSATKNLPLSVYFMLPSSVPATDLETSGARISAKDLKPLLKKDRILGLAELMNFPGVISQAKEVLAKIEAVGDNLIDGHAPKLSGSKLCAYIGAGASSEHEATTLEEAKEKLRLGMQILVREGSSAKNLAALLPLINERNSRFFSFCTDDRHPRDLTSGYLNKVLEKAVSLGLDPILAIQMASINTARHYNLKHLGAIAPGYFADLLVLDNLQNFNVEMVFKRGKKVAEKNKALFIPKVIRKSIVKETFRVKHLEVSSLKIEIANKPAKVLELVADQIVTKLQNLLLSSLPDLENDILKLVVVERHKATGNIGLGLVKGFGLKKGAIATSVVHDSHNIIAVGVSDEDMLSAIRQVIKLKGGIVVVSGGFVAAELALPIAGLMSEKTLSEVVEKFEQLEKATQEIGSKIADPFEILSFLALPVIPEIRLTDKGLIDVKEFKVVDLFE